MKTIGKKLHSHKIMNQISSANPMIILFIFTCEGNEHKVRKVRHKAENLPRHTL